MSRRSFLYAIGIFTLLACGAGAGLLILIRYVPAGYAQASLPAGPERDQKSRAFCQKFSTLYSAIGADPDWSEEFSDEQINSYFDEQFVQSGLDTRLLPEGVSQPRVRFEPDTIHLAFRYGTGFWSTVVSIDLRVWLARGEPNAVALQLVGFRAGALPIRAQSLLERVSEVARQNGIDVTWYRHEGYPVAMLRFQADQPRTTLQLLDVRLDPGTITIHGRSGDGGPHAAVAAQPAGTGAQ